MNNSVKSRSFRRDKIGPKKYEWAHKAKRPSVTGFEKVDTISKR